MENKKKYVYYMQPSMSDEMESTRRERQLHKPAKHA